MDYTIVHLSAEKRFETKSEELTAYVQYQIIDGKLDIIHTVVPHPIEGRGIASALVRFAYDFALENGLKPFATCSYAVTWLKRHSDYIKE